MKKLQFLLLDAGPIIELFKLGLWEKFIENCDVTISRIVVDECIYSDQNYNYITFPFEQAAQNNLIKIIEVEPSKAKPFIDKLNTLRYDIHSGEQEMLSFFLDSSEDYQVCSADKAVFRFLGFIKKGDCGISLEEALKQIGLARHLERQFTEGYRKYFTQIGETDSIQNEDF